MRSTPTFGYDEHVGYWQIDLPVPGHGSVEEYNHRAMGLAKVFLEAFSDLCSNGRAHGDFVLLDDCQHVTDVLEAVPLLPDDKGILGPPTEAGLSGTATPPIVDNVFVYCDVRVLPGAPGGRAPVDMAEGALLQYGTVNDTRPDGRTEPEESLVRFYTFVDPWLDVTFDAEKGTNRDNRAVAGPNRPRLERALRQWERVMGAPIVEWGSGPYPDRIDRYGFRAEDAPAPLGAGRHGEASR